MFPADGTLISASEGPHCGEVQQSDGAKEWLIPNKTFEISNFCFVLFLFVFYFSVVFVLFFK